jgi:ATP-binding cassette, subfamily B, bacterial PglK
MLNEIKITLSLLEPIDRRKYYFLVGGRAASGILDVIGMLLVGLVINVAISPDSDRALANISPGFLPEQFRNLTFFTAVLGTIFLFKGAFSVLIQWRLNLLLSKIETEQSLKVAEATLLGTLSNLKSRTPSEITFALVDSTTSAFSERLVATATIISEALLVTIVCTALCFIDLTATIFVGLYLGIVVGLVQVSVSKRLRKAGRIHADENRIVNSDIYSMIQAFREIYVYGKSTYFLQNFENSREKVAKALAAQRLMLSMPRFVIETALILGVVTIIGFQSVNGTLIETAPIIGIFLIGGFRLMASLVPLQSAVVNMRHTAELSRPALEILKSAGTLHLAINSKEETAYVETETSLNSQAKAYSLEISNMSFSFENNEKPTLSEISIQIESGEHIAIIGPSGGGKTTLVDLITGLHIPTKGKIRINGIEPRMLIKSDQPQISYVAQRPGIVPGSLAENIALGVEKKLIDNEKLLKAIKASQLEELIRELPEGLNSDLGNHVDSLSGGQMQRIGLARALYFEPKLLILDEATSALDAKTESIITKNLAKLGSKTTVIVIAHRLSTVQNAKRVFVMDSGKIVDQGTFQELRKNNPMVDEYVKLMSFNE